MDKEEDDRLIQEALDHRPSPHQSLLMRFPNDRNAHLSANLLRPGSYIGAYFKAAKKVSEQGILGPSSGAHEIVLPVIFLYRHFVELCLKECVYALGGLIHAHDPLFDFNPARRKLTKEHSLLELLKLLRGRHTKAERHLSGVRLPSDQALAFIKELGELSDEGFDTRYLLNRQGKRYIGDDWYFNLDVLDAGMLHIQRELSSYVDAVVETQGGYHDFLADTTP